MTISYLFKFFFITELNSQSKFLFYDCLKYNLKCSINFNMMPGYHTLYPGLVEFIYPLYINRKKGERQNL